MDHLRTLLILIGLSASLLSCIDHRGVPPENAQRMRLKYRFVDVINTDTGKPETSKVDFIYNASGKLVGVKASLSQNNGPFVALFHTILTYNRTGELLEETYVDEPGNPPTYAKSYTYEYDPLNRVSRVLVDNKVYQTLTYDAQNRVNSRTSYAYAGDVLALTVTESFSFDAHNNITTSVKTTKSQPGQGLASFRLKIVAAFDQSPNPIYQLPTRVIQQQATSNSLYSANNATEETQFETLQLTGDFPADAAIRPITHDRQYQNGLLVKDTVTQPSFVTMFRYEYEPY